MVGRGLENDSECYGRNRRTREESEGTGRGRGEWQRDETGCIKTGSSIGGRVERNRKSLIKKSRAGQGGGKLSPKYTES